MDQELEAFRSWVAEQRKRTARGGVRYPTERRTWAAEYAQRRMTGGSAFREVVKELTVSEPALRKWLANKSENHKAQLRPVTVRREIAPEPAVVPREMRALTLVTPRGFRIEGLDAASVVALMRELG